MSPISLSDALERVTIDPVQPGRAAEEIASLITGTSARLRWIDAVSHRRAKDHAELERAYRAPVEPWAVSGSGIEITVVSRDDAPVLAALTLAQANLEHENAPTEENFADHARAYKARQMRSALFTLVDSSEQARQLLGSLL